MIGRGWPNENFIEPAWEWSDWLCSHCWLGIDVEDVGGAPGAIIGGKGQDCTVVQ